MRIFAFYLAKMKCTSALGRMPAYICVIISISYVDANCNGCKSVICNDGNCVVCNGFNCVARSNSARASSHSFCAANMAAAVDNRA